jgi:hypothetical protein
VSDQDDPKDLGEVEVRARVAKLDLEMDKIALEKKSLARQLSWQGTALEWTKAASVFAALIGVATTLYLGQKQANLAQIAASNQSAQAEESRAAERFDKALSRLADGNAGVRMTGIAGLRLFLADGIEKHQKDALHYLVTAIAEERSPDVLQAILDAFVDAKGFSQAAKDDTLRTAIELDRSVTETVIGGKYALRDKAQRTLIAKLLSRKEADLPSDISDVDMKSLTFLQNMQVESLGARKLFYDPNVNGVKAPEDTVTLDKFVVVINLMIAVGAKNVTGNWSKIYCQNCDFTAAGDLSGSNFDGAFLRGADFTHVKLRDASFRDADLSQTVFFSSDLTQADLSRQPSFSRTDADLNAANGSDPYPYLECAILNGANLSDLPLAALWRDFSGARRDHAPSIYDQLTLPRMAHAKFDSQTKLNGFGIKLKFTFDGAYYSALPTEQKTQFEAAFSSLSFDWPTPLGDLKYGSAQLANEVSLRSGDQDTRIEYLSSNRATQLYPPISLSDWARPLFSKALDQPMWKAMPVAASILAASQVGPATTTDPVDVDDDDASYDCSQTTVPDRLEIVVTRFQQLLN